MPSYAEAALATPEQTERFIAHLPLVAAIARAICRAHRGLDYEDLHQDGCLGLLDAAVRFDPARRIPFRAFAGYRIRGAILDALRSRYPGWRRRCGDRCYRCAFRDPVADALRCLASSGDVRPAWCPSLAVRLLPLDHVRLAAEPEYLDFLLLERVKRYLQALPARQKVLIFGYYFEGRKMGDLAAQLNLSVNDAWLAHQKILRELRRQLTSGGEERLAA